MDQREAGTSDNAAASASPFSFVEHADLLGDVVQSLGQIGISRLHRYPTRTDRRILPFEAVNLVHALTGRGNYVMDRTAIPEFYRRLAGLGAPRAAALLRLFVNALPAEREAWRELLGADLSDRAATAGLLLPRGTRWASRVRIVPSHGRLFVTDAIEASRSDSIWLGKDSIILIEAMRRRLAGRRLQSGLEIGSGSGIVSIHLAHFCERVLGIDINPRALDCARLNARANSLERVEFRRSDLYRDVPETFDVIVSNPPHVFIAPAERATRIYADGGEDYGTSLQMAILDGLHERLNPDGVALLLLVSPVVRGLDVLPERVRSRLAERPLDFEFEPLFNTLSVENLAYHRAQGVQYNWVYMVTVRKANAFACRVSPAGVGVRSKSWAFRTLVALAR